MPSHVHDLYEHCFSSSSPPTRLASSQEARMLEDPQYAYLYARYVRIAPWRDDEEERAFFAHDDFLLRGTVEWALLYHLFVRNGQASRVFHAWVESKCIWDTTWADLLVYTQRLRSEPYPRKPVIELYNPQHGAQPLIIPAAFNGACIEATTGPHASYVAFSLITLRLPDEDPEFFYCRPKLSYGLAADTEWFWYARKANDSRWTLLCEDDGYSYSEWSHHEQLFADPLTWQHF